MKIPQNVILIWPSTNSSIPSGWTRETALDGKFPKAWGSENPNTTGGAETHTHTSPSHTHTLQNHTHSYTLSTVNPTSYYPTNDGTGLNFTSSHYHTGTSGDIIGGTINESLVYNSCSNRPPYYDLIFIKAGSLSILQQNIIALWTGWQGNNNPPNNWQECNGNNSSPDLRNIYLRGADSGANAGTTGGSYTNIHDISHSHTPVSHSHASSTSTSALGTDSKPNGTVETRLGTNHTHNVTLTNGIQYVNSYNGSVTCDEVVEPEYKKVMAIQFKTGAKKEKGIIGLWLGNTSDIPKGWVLCDGNNGTLDLRDKFIKIAYSSSEIGQTGGSNTHSHGPKSHSHTSNGNHSHSGNVSNHTDNVQRYGTSANYSVSSSGMPNHTITYVSAVAATYSSANTTANASDNQPPYRIVAYIQFQKEIYGGAILTNFL